MVGIAEARFLGNGLEGLAFEEQTLGQGQAPAQAFGHGREACFGVVPMAKGRNTHMEVLRQRGEGERFRQAVMQPFADFGHESREGGSRRPVAHLERVGFIRVGTALVQKAQQLAQARLGFPETRLAFATPRVGRLQQQALKKTVRIVEPGQGPARSDEPIQPGRFATMEKKPGILNRRLDSTQVFGISHMGRVKVAHTRGPGPPCSRPVSYPEKAEGREAVIEDPAGMRKAFGKISRVLVPPDGTDYSRLYAGWRGPYKSIGFGAHDDLAFARPYKNVAIVSMALQRGCGTMTTIALCQTHRMLGRTTMADMARPIYTKFGTDELMELVKLFNVSEEGQSAIREVLAQEKKRPNAHLFRYYNDQSRVAQLEKEFSAFMDSRYALAVNSGTSALIAAMVAAGVGPGDEVILPGYTFFASASAIVVAKAIPVIVDIDESLTLDPAAVEKAITPRTKAILVVHMVGHPARMDVLRDLADRRKLVLIEDVAQATGGSYKGKKLGTWGHLGCFSFDAYKVMATGEGGMVLTDDEWLYTRVQSYHDTAACWRPDRYGRERRAGELFCGENYRLSEMAGAIGLAQLRKLSATHEATHRNYHQLRAEAKLPKGVRWIEPADPKGVCGYSAAMLFDSFRLAHQAITANIGIGGPAGGGVQGARDWHLYWYWDHILEQKTATAEGCPFKCPHVKQVPAYTTDMCPRTKAIMMRVGLLGLTPADTSETVSHLARDLSANLARVMA